MSNLFDSIFPDVTGVANSILQLMGDEGVVHVGEKAYDPYTGINVEAVTDVPVITSPPLRYKREDYNETLIMRGDMYCFINGLHEFKEEELKQSNITINNTLFKVVNVTVYYSGVKIAAYKLQLRR